MRKLLQAGLVIGLASLSLSASATFLYSEDGKRIREGDSASKVIKHLGRPAYRRYDSECIKGRKDNCKKWIRVEYWQYNIKDLDWTLTIHQNKVRDLEWSR